MTEINHKILEKLEKFSKNKTELQMCKEILEWELRWLDYEDPPFKKPYSQILDRLFPFKEEE